MEPTPKLPPTVVLVEATPGYPILEIRHPQCFGRLALHGAHVMEWQPVSADAPVLYLSPDALLQPGKAIRGGIPICWPWFNAHPSDSSLPSHGFARTHFWELEAAEEDESGVTISLRFRSGDLAAYLDVYFGEWLEIALETTNLGDEPLPLSGALHTYLAISSIAQVQVDGLSGDQYLDTVGDRTERVQSGLVYFDREVDRIYENDSSALLVDSGYERVIVVEKEGSPSTVVWNPWVDKAKNLSDLPDEAYRDFVCIEAAISNDRAIILAPGGSHVLSTTLRVEDH
ncbi:glucose-6-phosphate 1-epimerase [Haloferula luteola]|uniref:Putative glucose-6-phosphate 1-epimerase n=1 Tax=Haloferula luteola TaxID=595692 RepID=A0A840VGM7_9BACT|nr:D-hexose-6-phosphate mutarotase [Haloferula luteola]MBB5353748.1 glucose-6-phosphate 1-epimerase [Haloferula luteola]